MNGKFFLAVIVTAIIAFFGGWLIFGIVLSSYYKAHTNPASFFLMKESMGALAIAILSTSVLITWIIQRTGSTTFMKGFATTLWVSFLIILTFDLNMYAFWDIFDLGILIVDVIASSIFWALIGGLAGWIIGREKNPVLAT
jgi:hypothetical protein